MVKVVFKDDKVLKCRCIETYYDAPKWMGNYCYSTPSDVGRVNVACDLKIMRTYFRLPCHYVFGESLKVSLGYLPVCVVLSK